MGMIKARLAERKCSMKRMWLAAGLLAAFSMGLQAQVLDARAKVSFDFWLGQKLMPAGEYSIYHMPNGGQVLVWGDEGKGTMFLAAPLSRTGKGGDAKLEFTRYGDMYFLSKIWNPYRAYGYGVPISSQERELASGNIPSSKIGVAILSK